MSPVSVISTSRAQSRLAIGVIALALLASTGCNSTKKSQQPQGVKLPEGELLAYVPQPNEVPSGLQPVLEQSGPADITKLASFSSNPTTAEVALSAHGFQSGYIAEYADPSTGRLITVVVSRFAGSIGATDDLSTDLSAKQPATVKAIIAPTVGDQSGAFAQPLPGGAAGSQLITIRFRVGNMTWLLAVGATGKVDVASVGQIASFLVKRAHAVSSASPAPSPS